jgi:hypothetical protein
VLTRLVPGWLLPWSVPRVLAEGVAAVVVLGPERPGVGAPLGRVPVLLARWMEPLVWTAGGGGVPVAGDLWGGIAG